MSDFDSKAAHKIRDVSTSLDMRCARSEQLRLKMCAFTLCFFREEP
jgi:hypothetical protein